MKKDLIIIGRASDCDHQPLDPRVSRKHAQIRKNKAGGMEIMDLGSRNGTFVNDRKIPVNQWIRISLGDRVTLSSDYVLELPLLFPGLLADKSDQTKVFQNGSDGASSKPRERRSYVKTENRSFAFDPDKTSIGEISQMDETPFKSIGRGTTNDIVITDTNISREHCRIRMLNRYMIQIEDLGSTNGTFADGKRLDQRKLYTFKSGVQIQLGHKVRIDLSKILPGLDILSSNVTPVTPNPASKPTSPVLTPLSALEKKAFEELQSLWQEYQDRQNKASSASMGYMMGGSIVGSVLGAALMPVTGGLSALVSLGGTAIGRYLGMQKTNEIRNDLNYEDAFLQAYACPRCLESFQKKPWITIRECHKCKVKFR